MNKRKNVYYILLAFFLTLVISYLTYNPHDPDDSYYYWNIIKYWKLPWEEGFDFRSHTSPLLWLSSLIFRVFTPSASRGVLFYIIPLVTTSLFLLIFNNRKKILISYLLFWILIQVFPFKPWLFGQSYHPVYFSSLLWVTLLWHSKDNWFASVLISFSRITIIPINLVIILATNNYKAILFNCYMTFSIVILMLMTGFNEHDYFNYFLIISIFSTGITLLYKSFDKLHELVSKLLYKLDYKFVLVSWLITLTMPIIGVSLLRLEFSHGYIPLIWYMPASILIIMLLSRKDVILYLLVINPITINLIYYSRFKTTAWRFILFSPIIPFIIYSFSSMIFNRKGAKNKKEA